MSDSIEGKSIRVIMSGGGTGGHIFPAIAIARSIQRRDPNSDVLFVGALGKMEMEKVPQAGFNIVGLPIVGIQRRITWRNLLVPFKVLFSLYKARKVIKEFKPDIAIGVGGYASGPLIQVAASMGIKCLIQEQNSYPGITNKLLSKKVDRICVAYEGLEKYFPPSKIVFTGNPVRSEVIDISTKRGPAISYFELQPDLKILLFVGGSLGARTINLSLTKCIEELHNLGFQIIWQTGKGYYETAKNLVESTGLSHVKVYEFIRDMDLAYAASDVIVSRAGAMSISELCLVGKPVVLIPSPNVSEDHQTKNAVALVNRGAAILLKDSDAPAQLLSVLKSLLADEILLNSLSENIRKMGKANADEEIANEVFKLIGQIEK